MKTSQQNVVFFLRSNVPAAAGAGTRGTLWVDLRDYDGTYHIIVSAVNKAKAAGRTATVKIREADVVAGTDPVDVHTFDEIAEDADNQDSVYTFNISERKRFLNVSVTQVGASSSFSVCAIGVGNKIQGKT